MAETRASISELVKNIPEDALAPGKEMIKEAVAYEFGNLTSNAVKCFPENTQVAIGVTLKCMSKLDSSISWNDLLENLTNNPTLQSLDSKDIYHHGEHKSHARQWFRNGELSKSGCGKLKKWMIDFIPSTKLFDDEKVTMEFCEKVVRRTLAELQAASEEGNSGSPSRLESFLNRISSSFTGAQDTSDEPVHNSNGTEPTHGGTTNPLDIQPKAEYNESPLVDVVVFRFPDDKKQNEFVAYNLKLKAWTNIIHHKVQPKEYQVGTKGEYFMRRFIVREEFVKEMKEETRIKAIAQAQSFFSSDE